MASTEDTKIPLEPECQYHIFNRGNGGINIFYAERHYTYFLKKYKHYCAPYLDTYSYCLLPNHFHFLVEIKTTTAILKAAKDSGIRISKLMLRTLDVAVKRSNLGKLCPVLQSLPDLEDQDIGALYSILPELLHSALASWLVSEQFRRFFLSYSKAINLQVQRNGSLFQKNFHRKLINSEPYFTALVWYLHRNSAHHKIDMDWTNYPWSSYQSLLSEKPTGLRRDNLMAYFGDRAAFIDFHRQLSLEQDLMDRVILE